MSVSSRVRTAVVAMLVLPACGAETYPGLVWSPFVLSVGTAHSTHDSDQVSTVTPIDPADFQPPGGSMTTTTGGSHAWEYSLGTEVFQMLPAGFIVGLSGNYLISIDNADSVFFTQVLRRTYLNWWDTVLVEQIVLHRTPSIGGYVGKSFAGHWPDGRLKYDGFTVQYGIAISGYSIKRYDYSGVDVYGAKDSSVLKSSTSLASGMAVRQTIEVGWGEAVRLGFWWESDGAEKMGGIRLVLGTTIRMLRTSTDGNDDDGYFSSSP